MNKVSLIFLLSFVITLNVKAQKQKDYTQESEEDYLNRMEWFSEAKYGMFIHFGLYSQLGGVWKGETAKGYAEWIQARAEISANEYTMLTHTFNPKDFNAEEIVSLAKEAGMKYIVITTKHHEGFCLWDSKYTNYDVANTPFKRDILAELSKACRENGIRFGTYYSLIDWSHSSQQVNYTGSNWWTKWGHIQMKVKKRDNYIEYMKNQLKELIENYDTDLLWFDGDWVEWWNNDVGTDLYNYARSLKPEIIINNRVGKRGSFLKDYKTMEQRHSKAKDTYPWEACYTLNKSWGYKLNDHKWKSPETVFQKITEINNNGGNLLLNIGPDGLGRVPPKSKEILLEVGKMLNEKK